MSELKDISIDDLEEELERRKTAKCKVPELLAYPTIVLKMNEAIGWVKGCLIDKANHERVKYFENYCFETLLEMFYGDDIWDWYNNSDEE